VIKLIDYYEAPLVFKTFLDEVRREGDQIAQEVLQNTVAHTKMDACMRLIDFVCAVDASLPALGNANVDWGVKVYRSLNWYFMATRLANEGLYFQSADAVKMKSPTPLTYSGLNHRWKTRFNSGSWDETIRQLRQRTLRGIYSDEASKETHAIVRKMLFN
jgi:hypothetical protein